MVVRRKTWVILTIIFSTTSFFIIFTIFSQTACGISQFRLFRFHGCIDTDVSVLEIYMLPKKQKTET